jgi:penicillin-binding protein 2
VLDPVTPQQGRGGPPVSPQLALRVAILGGIALALFAVVFLRLWFLQVLTGDQYRQEALDNRVRTVAIAAPRGNIVDRGGRPIVENRVATVVQLDPRMLPAAQRDNAARWGQQMGLRAQRPKGRRGEPVPIPPPATPELERRFARLGEVLGVPARVINERVIQQLAVLPYANVRVKVDVPASMRNYLLERQREFPGVAVQQAYLRRYPMGTMAAQLVGTTGEIAPEQIGTERYRGVVQGTVVGQQGIERSYDRYLRGTSGTQSITVDAAGRPKSQRVAREPRPGRQLRTSLDTDLQRVGERALASVVQGGTGTAGAFVALDPRNGEVLAMGSYPTFDPAVLAKPISQARYDAIFGDPEVAPQFNRAIGGTYPTASTFKAITALAALDKGLITPETPINDPGVLRVGAQEFKNAGDAVHGTISLRRALQVSSDVFFYTLGRDANGLEGQVIQSWARKLGLGRAPKIDLPGAAAGTIPDRAWRRQKAADELECRERRKVASCGISDARRWSVGDNINLSVGQGDVQASPLQMAVAYAAIANGGKVVRPHLGLAVEDDAGSEIQRLERPAARTLDIDPGQRQAIAEGLHLSTLADGTSAKVFSDWNQDRFPVYGKTGTAERQPKLDQSWYVAWVPHPTKPIVIAATVEQGGFGSDAAAPLTCRMLASWFDQKASCAPGRSRTN